VNSNTSLLPADVDTTSLLLFHAHESVFGIDASTIQQIHFPGTGPPLEATPTPFSQILLGAGTWDDPTGDDVTLLEVSAEDRHAVIAVNGNVEIRDLESQQLQPLPKLVGETASCDYLDGLVSMDGGLVLLVDLQRWVRAHGMDDPHGSGEGPSAHDEEDR